MTDMKFYVICIHAYFFILVLFYSELRM